MMMFTLKNTRPVQPLLIHDEPIYLEDKTIGITISGNFHFALIKTYPLAI